MAGFPEVPGVVRDGVLGAGRRSEAPRTEGRVPRIRRLLCALGILAVLGAPCRAGGDAADTPGDVPRAGADVFVRMLAPPPEDAGPILGLLEKSPRGASWRWDPDFGLLGAPWDGIAEEDAEPTAAEQVEDVRRFLREFAEGADPRPLLGPALRRIVVDVSVEVEGEPPLTGQVVARPSVRAVHARVRSATLLRDYDPELACDNSWDGSRPSALGNPIVADVSEGLVADVRPFPLDGGRRVALEALVQWGRLEGPVERISTGARFLGEMDLPACRGGVALVSGTVRSGEPLVTRVASDGRVTTITLRARVEGPEEPVGTGRVLRCLDAGLAWLPPWQATRAGPDLWDLDATVHPFVLGRPTLADPGVAMDAGDPLLGPVDLHVDPGGRVWCAGPAEDLARLEARLAAASARRARAVHLEVRAFAGDREIARVETQALDGRGALLRIGRDRAFLQDADAEVG